MARCGTRDGRRLAGSCAQHTKRCVRMHPGAARDRGAAEIGCRVRAAAPRLRVTVAGLADTALPCTQARTFAREARSVSMAWVEAVDPRTALLAYVNSAPPSAASVTPRPMNARRYSSEKGAGARCMRLSNPEGRERAVKRCAGSTRRPQRTGQAGVRRADGRHAYRRRRLLLVRRGSLSLEGRCVTRHCRDPAEISTLSTIVRKRIS